MNFLKVAAVCPEVFPAEFAMNETMIIQLLHKLNEAKVQAAVFPELCITGCTCKDLFFQEHLLKQTAASLEAILAASSGSDLFFVIGAPVRNGNRLYNCALAMQNGRLLGIVPKCHLNEEERRWFVSPLEAPPQGSVTLAGQEVPFGRLLFSSGETQIGLEIGEDLLAPLPPSTALVLSGADLILNPAAWSEQVTGAVWRRAQVLAHSARTKAGYLSASAGVNESTTDLLYSGHLLIAENGTLLAENQRFQTESEFVTAWLDVEALRGLRLRDPILRQETAQTFLQTVPFQASPAPLGLFDRPVDPHPFIPEDAQERAEHCREILHIQSHALAKRLRAAGSKKSVLGISGGLDSTLALLVIQEAMAINGKGNKDIITLTMPGFGTTDRTYQNALELCRELGTDLREINIVAASLQHFADIGHDPKVHDATYENTQARERTQILMDLANKENGLVVGTGDLSELALGWATYNGDHMSMYGVNAAVAKTLVRELVLWSADSQESPRIAAILRDIAATPVSPELLPKDAQGGVIQKTEDLIGPYELHDFFLYHMLGLGADPDKILFLAGHAFSGRYSAEDIRRWLALFLKRFFQNQFKRSALPDGPAVGPISLSPRGGLSLASDLSYRSWSIE